MSSQNLRADALLCMHVNNGVITRDKTRICVCHAGKCGFFFLVGRHDASNDLAAAEDEDDDEEDGCIFSLDAKAFYYYFF